MPSAQKIHRYLPDTYIGAGVAQPQEKSAEKKCACSKNGTPQTMSAVGNPSNTHLYTVDIVGLITYASTIRG